MIDHRQITMKALGTTVPTPGVIGPYTVSTIVAIGIGATALAAAIYYALRK